MLFSECEFCGAALDPGEKCDCEQEMNLPAIRCTQPPIIDENLGSIRQRLEDLLADISVLPSTDESLKYVKQVRANLAKDFDQMETQRKAVKRQVMEPYDQAEKKYKENISDPYKAADQALKNWVDGYQNSIKRKCEDTLRAYFNECCQSLKVDFLKLENCGIVVDMALARQKEPRKALDRIFEFVTNVRNELDIVATMEDSSEILIEYKRRLSLSDAIAEVNARKQAKAAAQAFLEQQQRRQAQQEQHRAQLAAAAPEIQQIQEERYSVAFLATGTLTALKAMKAHAQTLGITFEEIKQEDDHNGE